MAAQLLPKNLVLQESISHAVDSVGQQVERGEVELSA